MAKVKRQRYAEINENPLVIEHDKIDSNVAEIITDWRKSFFKNQNPICIELGCGRGEYTIALARRNPHINYIGIDIKGARLWKGADIAKEESLKNVAFLRIQIEHVLKYFPKQKIDELWITFPDPFLRESRAKKRLTSQRFLDLYKVLLKKDATIHLKTDEIKLYLFTLETIKENKHTLLESSSNLYHSDLKNKFPELTEVQTKYELKYIQEEKTITYIKFRLKP